MFKINTNMIITNEEKLLYNIQELLIEQNKLIKESLQAGNTITPEIKNDSLKPQNTELKNLKRGELMAKVKELPNKPKNWSKLKNEELINLLVE